MTNLQINQFIEKIELLKVKYADDPVKLNRILSTIKNFIER